MHSIRPRKLITLIKTQITYVPVQGSFFYRSSFSAAELDDTCRERPRVDFPRILAFTITANAHRFAGKTVRK